MSGASGEISRVTWTVQDVDACMSRVFDTRRTPRSAAYRAGVRCIFEFFMLGRGAVCMYAAGTAEHDAFYAGCFEGHQAYGEHLQRERKAQERRALEKAA